MEIDPPVLEKKIFEWFLPYMGVAASEKTIFEIVDDDEDGRRTTDHGHPISSPCEPSAQVS